MKTSINLVCWYKDGSIWTSILSPSFLFEILKCTTAFMGPFAFTIFMSFCVYGAGD